MISKQSTRQALPDVSALARRQASVWRALGDRLRHLELTAEVAAPVGRVAAHLPEPMRTPIRRWHLNNVDGPLGSAMRLLILGDPVSPHEADLALGAGLTVSLLKGGL